MPSLHCSRCTATFSTQRALSYHLRTYCKDASKLKQLRCNNCKTQFVSNQLLSLHLHECTQQTTQHNLAQTDLGDLNCQDDEEPILQTNVDSPEESSTGFQELHHSPLVRRETHVRRKKSSLTSCYKKWKDELDCRSDDDPSIGGSDESIPDEQGNKDLKSSLSESRPQDSLDDCYDMLKRPLDEMFNDRATDANQQHNLRKVQLAAIDEEKEFVQETVTVTNHNEAVREAALGSTETNVVKDGDKYYTLLEQLRGHLAKGHKNFEQSGQYKCQVELLQLLKKAGASLLLYDELMQWSYRSSVVHKYSFKELPQSRTKIMNKIIGEYNMEGMLPKTIEFQLPNCKKMVKVTVHDIRQAIYSLLTDPEVMKDENLIFRDNPFEEPVHKPAHISDINDGQAYYMAFQTHVKVKGEDVLCPILLYIDKTHTDQHNILTLEPILITLGIFNLEARFKVRAWRTIGYVPSFSKVELKTLTTEARQQDYHSMLDVIFAPLAQLQKSGIVWRLRYKDKYHKVVLKIPILFISGDSEGHDKLVGRKLSYVNVSHLCRYCDCPFEETGNPARPFTERTQGQLERLLRNNNTQGLNAIGYYNLGKNAMHQLIFCDSKRGLHGALLAELLHTFQHGLHLYATKGLFDAKKKRKKPKKKAKNESNKKRKLTETKTTQKDKKKTPTVTRNIQKDNEIDPPMDDDLYTATSAADLSTHRVFGSKECDMFDVFAKQYGRFLQRQSDRDLPRTYFPTGITGNSKKNGHEMQGVLLLIVTIFLSSSYETFKESFGEKRLSYTFHLFEVLMVLEEFLKLRSHERKNIVLLEYWMPIFLQTYIDVVNREEKNRMNILKVHLPRHIPKDIIMDGPAAGSNSAIGESHHITTAKVTANATQRRAENLEEQSGNRYVENLSIDRAISGLQDSGRELRAESAIVKDDIYRGQSYFMNDDGIFIVKRKPPYKQAPWTDPTLYNSVFQFLKMEVLPNVRGDQINLMTQWKHNGIIFRANPRHNTGSWHDWVNIDWGDDGVIPAHLLIYVDLTLLETAFTVNEIQIAQPGKYALIHMVDQPLTAKPRNSKNTDFKAHQGSKLFDWSEKITDNEDKPIMALISPASFHSVCIGIPADLEGQTAPNSFLFLKPRNTWPDILVEHVKDVKRKEREKKKALEKKEKHARSRAKK